VKIKAKFASNTICLSIIKVKAWYQLLSKQKLGVILNANCFNHLENVLK